MLFSHSCLNLKMILNQRIPFLFCSLMRDAEKLMSRCIYLNVLKATISAAKENETSSETLEKYIHITLAVLLWTLHNISCCWKILHKIIVWWINMHSPTPPWRISWCEVRYSCGKLLSVISVMTAICWLSCQFALHIIHIRRFLISWQFDCSWYQPNWFHISQANEKEA